MCLLCGNLFEALILQSNVNIIFLLTIFIKINKNGIWFLRPYNVSKSLKKFINTKIFFLCNINNIIDGNRQNKSNLRNKNQVKQNLGIQTYLF